MSRIPSKMYRISVVIPTVSLEDEVKGTSSES